MPLADALDLGAVFTPQDAQQGLALAMPTQQVPVSNAGHDIGGGMSHPQTTTAPVPPPPGTIRMPTQTITAPGAPPLSAQAARDLAYNENVARAYQLGNQGPNTNATVQALQNAGATPMQGGGPPPGAQPAATPIAATPIVANPYAAKAGGGPSPAMNVPLANPADIAGIAQAQKGEQAEEQGAYNAKIAGDEATEKLTGGEAADAKIRDIEGGIKANRARLDDEAFHKTIREGYERQNAMLVDPNHYAKSLDTGHKIMQTLANIFAGYSAGIHGGPNQAVEDYNRRVQQDIDAQKDNIANGYHSLAGQESAYEAHLQATGSPQQAEALSLAAHQEMLKTALGKIMASTTSREDYNKANAAWYAAAQLQHETRIKFHKYFPAGAMGGAPAAAGAGPTAADVTSARALSAIGNLEKEGEIPGTSWLDRLRHLIATKTGLGGSIESPEATRFYDAKDSLVAKKMELDRVKRISEDSIADYGKRWQSTEQMDQLRREVQQGLADKEALPAKGSKGRGRAAEAEEEP